ncbi:sensor histidine kinase [Flavobacterium aciduliphilum]|uniref:Two component regulator with propeller domain n=1 Tax=Flavobacterium aciduliphilum TaxID=1101402 RepID=A0A328YR52_9FLAO|nr:histidine kinase [Flavobacterium aciduliphilum]RAR72556.1 two component regulator with propeller domain [Flavobacterium aciduliphilum]
MNLLVLLPKKQTLSIVLFFFFLLTQSQSVKNLTIADGLPGNAIKCLFKDSNGLMWIGTETGLCTYDGLHYRIIGEEQGLKYNLIWKITEDNKKNIWLSLYGNGVAKYDGKKFTYYSKKEGLINNAVRSMCFSEKHNCMVFGTEDGLSVFDGKKFKNFDFEINNPNKNFQVNFISKYNDKIVFGVNHYNIYELKINPNNIQNSQVLDYLFPETKNYSGLIVGDNFYGHDFLNDFDVYNLKTHQKTSYGFCPVIWDYASDNQNNIYAACWDVNEPRGGLLCFEKNKLSNLSEKLQLPTSLFWCLYFDKVTNQLWVGSVDQGVFVINLSKDITYYSKDILGIQKPEINSICIDKNNAIWYGGNNFIAKKDTDGIKSLTNENIKIQILRLISDKTNLDKNNYKIFLKNSKNFVCHSIKKDESGTIWALTNYGLFSLDEHLKIITFLYYQGTGGVFDFIDSKTILLSQNYYDGYIVRYENIKQYKTLLYKEKPIGLDATKIFKSNQGLWIASYSKGLLLLENGTLKSMTDMGFLYDKNINEVFVDSNQNVVTSTISGKVYFSRWKNNRLSHFKIMVPDKDLIGNAIFFIRQYDKYYFIGTNKGLNIIKDFKLFKFINQTENLKQTIYTDAQIDFKNNKLIISTNNGLLSINIETILRKQKVNSPTRITGVKVNDKSIKNQSDLQLNYNENNIEFYFNSNNLYNATKNRYRYKIVGLKNSWSAYSSENSLKLFGLKSGNYKLIIQGKNIGTNELIAPISMRFTIFPPFWQTTWFMGFVTLTLILLLFLYLKRKIKAIKHKAELEKRIAETKLQALQSQMNPHFVFNAMSSIQNFVIDNQTDDALWYMGEFSKLMRQTLDFSSKTTIQLEEEIDYLNRYIELENLRRKHKVSYTLTIDEAIDTHEIQIPPMLLEPLVENVFVHAFDSAMKNCQLDIAFLLESNTLICKVTDNGKGYDGKGKTSKGLNLVQERLQLFQTEPKNSLNIQKLVHGTLVQISISIR